MKINYYLLFIIGLLLMNLSGKNISYWWILIAVVAWALDLFLFWWLPNTKAYTKIVAWTVRIYYRIKYGRIAKEARDKYIKKQKL